MNEASTTQPQTGEVKVAAGRGRHRGPVSAHDCQTAPRGRHRKPAEKAETAA